MALPSCVTEELRLAAADGVTLAATLYLPRHPNSVTVQINASLATKRRYYHAFSAALAEQGFTLLTYEYRGVGDSGYAPPAAGSSLFLDWGRLDQTAAADYLQRRFPNFAPVVLAHSMGGQLLGLTPHARRWRAALLVTTPHVYWYTWRSLRKWVDWLQSFVLAPAVYHTTGEVPVSWFGFADLQPAARYQFLRTRHQREVIDNDRGACRPYNDVLRVPLRLITFSDDEVVPPGREIDLLAFYPNARATHEARTPADYGTPAVGHFGFFRKSMPITAWMDAADWLRTRSISNHQAVDLSADLRSTMQLTELG